MAALRFSDSLAFGPSDFPLRSLHIELELEFATDVPKPAQKRFVSQALRKVLEKVDQEDLLTSVGAPRRRRSSPQRPLLHAKSAKSVHRFLLAVAELSREGGAPTLGEVGSKASLSGPPIAKIVNPQTPAGVYAAPLIKIRKEGHYKRITLTAKGRRVAAKVAAGELAS